MDRLHQATHIVSRLVQEGYKAYFAGGWVRDHIMKHPSSDIDIATDAPPEVILDLFPHTILVGLAFGVVIVVLEGHQFEVSTFRRDLHYEGGRRPAAIEFSDAREDALRRDFTINGMFYNPLEEEILDYVGGVGDIQRGILRTIGNADERFREDRLRMIRAVRFATRFGFQIDPETQQAIIENAESLFPPVAKERVWQEFNKMAAYPHFDHAIIEMHRLGLLQEIFPSLKKIHLNDIKKIASAYPHFLPGTPTIWFLAELFRNASLNELLEIFQTLKVSGHDLKLLDYLMHVRNLTAQDGQTDLVAWAHAYAHSMANVCLAVEAARLPAPEKEAFLLFHGQRQEELREHVQRIRGKRPLVGAAQLLEQGVAPGIQMGKLIKEAERLAIVHDLSDAQSVLNLLKPQWKGR